MKIRYDFVTNSSSSSFIVLKNNICFNQYKKIMNIEEEAKKLNLEYTEYISDWDISETSDYIKFYTYLDNFDMEEFLNKIGINSDCIIYN